jgi:hypothetical protein
MHEDRLERAMTKVFNFIDAYLGAVLAVVFTIGALILLASIADGVQERRSYDGQVYCFMQQMRYARKTFSSKVSCVPWPYRQDTSTIKLIHVDSAETAEVVGDSIWSMNTP